MRTAVDAGKPVAKFESEVEGEGGSRGQRPMAQEVDVDAPMEGNARFETQRLQSEAENVAAPEGDGSGSAGATVPPPPSSSSPQPPRQPLPALRQGIPSTFQMEFGQAQARAAAQDAAEQNQRHELDLTYDQRDGQQQRDRGERDYDRSAYETSLDRRRAALANYLYVGILFTTLTGAFYLSRPFSTREEVPPNLLEEDAQGWSPTKMYARVRARFGHQLGYYTEPTFPKLLPEVPVEQRQPFTLVLSLEDLMIHSTWDREHGYRTAKRPGIDYFIRYLSQYYELVLFTSTPLAMADPVIKKLDPYHFLMWNLGREATKYEKGEYVKDLSYLNRDLKKTLIIDTHAPHVRNQPENAIVVEKWSGDPRDPGTKDLVALIPFLEYVATMGTEDVRPVLASFAGTHIPTEFARRESLARQKFLSQLEAEKSGRPRRSLGSLGSALGIKSAPGTAPGAMILSDGQSVAEGLAQGKMLSDQIREQGQRNYEFQEKQIREHGAQWLREEEEAQKAAMEVS